MNFSKLFFAPVVAIVGWQSAIASSQAALAPENLQCEYRVNPLGIDALPPRLTWQVQSDERDQHQVAYEILVAGDEDLICGLLPTASGGMQNPAQPRLCHINALWV